MTNQRLSDKLRKIKRNQTMRLTMAKSTLVAALMVLLTSTAFAQETEEENPSYLKSVISTDNATEVLKSTIFDASQSFIPDPDREITYEWDFGDGNRNEGIEVLHAYKDTGYHKVTLKISDGQNISQSTIDVFAYRKLIVLVTDQTQDQDRLKVIQNFAEKNGVYLKIIESFGSSTEFISEEVLTKRLTEEAAILQKTKQIIVWTKENSGLNSISRFIQNNPKKAGNFQQKSIIVLENDISSKINRVERQFSLIKAKNIILAQEGQIDALIKSGSEEEFISTLKERGSEFEVITDKSGKLRPWNFMSYFVRVLVNNGIPDNTIALLLLLPVIATVVAFMRQVVGITTFGIYTPSIITLSFLIIGMHAGLITLLAAIAIGSLSRPLLKKVHMLFIPKMAIVITVVTLTLFLILIGGTYLNLFNAQFLSIAIFPMLILSTLVEKFVSAKSEKGLSSATMLMGETLLTSIIAYFIAGGEINLGIVIFKFDFIKSLMLNYPETVLLILIVNILLGKWSGLRILERVRFREVLRHIEE